MIKKWVVRPARRDVEKELMPVVEHGALLCAVLAARGFDTHEQARQFLTAEYDFESSSTLSDIDAAAQRINLAVENGEKIAIFGDYDVDGVTSSAMLYLYLDSLGAQVEAVLPQREGSGYGLSLDAIRDFGGAGTSLIITVDNGIAANGEIDFASSLGIDVVVCDHHLPGEALPDAVAVVDPLRRDDNSAFKHLSGAGVALKLISAVEGCSVEEMAEHFGYLAAIGTIADIMPLVGENRTLVKRGLAQLAECESLGLMYLCEEAGIDLSNIDSRTVAFGIAPRLNAAGRIGDARDAFRLLVTEDEDEARELAKLLDEQNRQRQQIEREISARIEAEIEGDRDLLRDPVIVLSCENAHPGVIGIACSRLVERYGKPVIIISTENGEGKGSGRSVKGFSLFDALCSCREALERFGGHELAAGLTIKTENIPLLRSLLREHCKKLGGMPFLELTIDAVPDPRDITVENVAALSLLEPCGAGNEPAVFALRNAVVEGITPLSEGKHSRVSLECGGVKLSMAMFSKPPASLASELQKKRDVVFSAGLFAGGGRTSVSLKATAMRPSDFDENTFASIAEFKRFMFTREYSQGLCVTRADVAAVYRAVGATNYPADNPASIICDCAPLAAGRVLACVEILRELGLIAAETAGGAPVWTTVKNAEKTELSRSEIYAVLSGC